MIKEASEISKTATATTVSQHVRDDAQFELRSNKPADQAVATLDSSKAVKEMFPGDDNKQDAAYRILMHNLKQPGYSKISEGDASQFTEAQIKSFSKFGAEYKPSVSVAKVEAEAKELKKLGFPQPTMEADGKTDGQSGKDAAGYTSPYESKGGK
jgi:hypothetical protein